MIHTERERERAFTNKQTNRAHTHTSSGANDLLLLAFNSIHRLSCDLGIFMATVTCEMPIIFNGNKKTKLQASLFPFIRSIEIFTTFAGKMCSKHENISDEVKFGTQIPAF